MRKLIICIILIFCCLEIHSQTKIDSIMSIFQDETKADTIRLKAIHTYINNNPYTITPDSLFILAGLQYELAASNDLKSSMANALFAQGFSQSSKGDYTIVLNYYIQGLKVLEGMDDKKKWVEHSILLGAFIKISVCLRKL